MNRTIGVFIAVFAMASLELLALFPFFGWFGPTRDLFSLSGEEIIWLCTAEGVGITGIVCLIHDWWTDSWGVD